MGTAKQPILESVGVAHLGRSDSRQGVMSITVLVSASVINVGQVS